MSGVKKDDFEFLFSTKSIDISGRVFVLKELSVAENDACWDASKNEDGTYNGRTNIRMMITKSAVDPTISLDQLAKFPNRVYLQLAEAVNELNSIDDAETPATDEEESGEGNA